MATAKAIRDRIALIISQLVPSALQSDRFVESREDEDGNFQEYTNASPSAAMRRFQTQDIGEQPSPIMSTTDIELLQASFRTVIAYPLNYRAGSANSTSRHALMTEDASQVVRSIGLSARASFSGASDSVWISGEVTRAVGETCDYLIIMQTMQFYRSY